MGNSMQCKFCHVLEPPKCVKEFMLSLFSMSCYVKVVVKTILDGEHAPVPPPTHLTEARIA